MFDTRGGQRNSSVIRKEGETASTTTTEKNRVDVRARADSRQNQQTKHPRSNAHDERHVVCTRLYVSGMDW